MRWRSIGKGIATLMRSKKPRARKKLETVGEGFLSKRQRRKIEREIKVKTAKEQL